MVTVMDAARPRLTISVGGISLFKRLRRDQRGVALLEFVICCTLLVLIFTWISNLGLALKDRLAISVTARESGREAALTGSVLLGDQKAQEILDMEGVPAGRATVSVTYAGTNRIETSVTDSYPFLIGGNGITLRSSKVFRIE